MRRVSHAEGPGQSISGRRKTSAKALREGACRAGWKEACGQEGLWQVRRGPRLVLQDYTSDPLNQKPSKPCGRGHSW